MLRLIRERGREGGECKDKLQVPKAKGASGLMYIILEKHLTKELREIVYPCIPDPDGEDEGGQASSSLAVST
ncbi:hypothetical protein GW17_00038357 [Ensete ventricosum]|nr:hypothetical protein GW17_00038357 [Ensete ventricosum]